MSDRSITPALARFLAAFASLADAHRNRAAARHGLTRRGTPPGAQARRAASIRAGPRPSAAQDDPALRRMRLPAARPDERNFFE